MCYYTGTVCSSDIPLYKYAQSECTVLNVLLWGTCTHIYASVVFEVYNEAVYQHCFASLALVLVSVISIVAICFCFVFLTCCTRYWQKEKYNLLTCFFEANYFPAEQYSTVLSS